VRTIGLILVILGALVLGYHGFAVVERDSAATDEAAPTNQKQTATIPPVVGGIAVTGGLLLLVSGGKRG
jgi:hypothetical protein